MGLSQSRGMKLWDVLYPVCIYFVVTAVTAILLDYVLPESVDSRLLRQLLTSFAALPFLYSFYRQDVRMQGELSMGAFGKPPKTRPLHLLVIFFTGGLLALALNNLLGFARIAEHSAAYRQVEQTFYTGRLALEIFALCAVIPLVEELLYRGIVYGRLRRWLGAAPAMLLSALIFGLIHMNLAQFIYASLFGLILAFFVDRTGSILGAFAAHMAANLTSVLRAETGAFAFMDQNLTVQLALTAAFMQLSLLGIFFLLRAYPLDRT